MKFTAQVENEFAKFELYGCEFAKPTTIAKHLMTYVEKKTGYKCYEFFDNDKHFWKYLSERNHYGDYHYEERWTGDWSEDGNGKEVPEYLAWIVDITEDADGKCVYMYFGLNISKSGYRIPEDFVEERDNTIEE